MITAKQEPLVGFKPSRGFWCFPLLLKEIHCLRIVPVRGQLLPSPIPLGQQESPKYWKVLFLEITSSSLTIWSYESSHKSLKPLKTRSWNHPQFQVSQQCQMNILLCLFQLPWPRENAFKTAWGPGRVKWFSLRPIVLMKTNFWSSGIANFRMQKLWTWWMLFLVLPFINSTKLLPGKKLEITKHPL